MDAYTLSYLSGSLFVFALVGYVVGRKLVGRDGVTEVRRLQQLAGLAEPDARAPSAWRGVVPFVLAAAGAVCGVVFGVVSLVFVDGGFVYSTARLEQGFLSGCERPCASGGTGVPECKKSCACMLHELKRTHTTSRSLGKLFQAANAKDPAALREVRQAAGRCMPRPTLSR